MSMKKTEIRYLALSLALGLLGMVCIGVLPSLFLWRLVDVADHFQAQMTFLAAAVMAIAGVFLLDAFVMVMRYGVLRAQRGIVSRVYSILHTLVRVLFAFCNAFLLLAAVGGVVLSGAQLVGCVFTLLMLAGMVGGYVLIFRLEKQLKARADS